MEAIGEYHSSMIQNWQRMTAHHDSHYGGNQHLMIQHQNSVAAQNSPINGSIEGGFTYGSAQTDGQ